MGAEKVDAMGLEINKVISGRCEKKEGENTMKDTIMITMGNETSETYAQMDVNNPNDVMKNIIANSIRGMADATSEMNYEKAWYFTLEFAEVGQYFEISCNGADFPKVLVETGNAYTSTSEVMRFYYAIDDMLGWIWDMFED